MTKKFLALTMVLVLAAGFAAVAAEHEDDRALMGTWENELTLDPNADDNSLAALESILDVEYTMNGISYTSVSEFSLDGFEKQEFGVDSSVGLLDLTSTLNMDPSGSNLRYWESGASMTLGGVSIGASFYLQKHDWDHTEAGYQATFWPGVSASDYPAKPTFGTVEGNPDDRSVQTDSFVVDSRSWDSDTEESSLSDTSVTSFHDYGSGLELTFSGETPGGVSVDVTNTFGMMPTSDAEADLQDMLDTKVKDGLLAFAGGAAELSDVTGQQAINWLEALLAQHPNSVSATDQELAKALLVSQLSIGDADNSGEDYSSFAEITDDFDYWADHYEAPTDSNHLGDANFEISDKVRDAAKNIVQKTLTLGGVAADTGMVVNTEFDLGDVEFLVDASEKEADTSSASVSLYLDTVEVGAGQYGGSSLQYYSTLVELDNLSLGCCEFSNETKFTEHNGFDYTLFEFSMTNNQFPIDVAADLRWDNDPDNSISSGKSVTLTPSLSTDWSCFTVYSELTTGSSSNVFDGMTVKGFELSAELGHVEVTSVTALGDYYVSDLVSSYHEYDEVLTIDKLASAGDLDFVLDVYTNMGDGLMPTAMEGSASYPVSSQFDLGSSLALTQDGLQEVGLSLDYSF